MQSQPPKKGWKVSSNATCNLPFSFFTAATSALQMDVGILTCMSWGFIRSLSWASVHWQRTSHDIDLYSHFNHTKYYEQNLHSVFCCKWNVFCKACLSRSRKDFFFFNTILPHMGFLPPMNWAVTRFQSFFEYFMFSQNKLSCTSCIHQGHVHYFILEMQCTTACHKHLASVRIFLT